MNEMTVAPKRGRQVAAVQPSAPAPLPTDGGILGMIAAAAVRPDFDPENLRALIQMKREVEADEATREFTAAYVRLSGVLPRIPKNGKVVLGGGKGYDFAKWEDMHAALSPMLKAEGFALTFDTTDEEGRITIIGTLIHRAGHSRTSRKTLPIDTGAGRGNLQAHGSTLSYGRRYVTMNLLNIAQEGADDDGAAGGRQTISDAQVARLRELLAELAADRHAGFFDYMGAPKLEDFAASDFKRAEAALWGAVKAQRKQVADLAGEAP